MQDMLVALLRKLLLSFETEMGPATSAPALPTGSQAAQPMRRPLPHEIELVRSAA